MRNVLIFGAAGFLGRHVRAELTADFNVVCPSRADCDLVGVDVLTLTELVRVVRPVAVVNCAGLVAGTTAELVTGNTVVTAKIIDSIARGAPDARFVRLGSAAEYGRVPHGHSVSETDQANPLSEYGVSQLAATRLVDIATAAGRLDGVVLRVFNPVGPGLPTSNVLGDAARLLQTAISRGASEVPLALLDTYRDFVDVRDIAAAVRATVLAGSLPERVFNIASGTTVSVREAVRLLCRTAGYPGEVRGGELAPSAARSAAVPWMRADVSRAARVLGWTARHDLASSLKALWADTATPPGPRPRLPTAPRPTGHQQRSPEGATRNRRPLS
ncbi:NAD(P)-dependent oxidoreductase [Verrucosispora sp. FIM060022]|uniref:NAD-dependent epimerase/dehydratase family protein n=1 Tax=Verrucosispora sp. FIM060022 TaxID=1479020 RepID=UPI000F86BA22|nr:NAD(P)-dependent oxidoreductase [Verrucosispora sp. FIM060022]RUL92022.1 NAD(P)-dependent oxidoreductase [Verrucosispora sp. FIM060022]